MDAYIMDMLHRPPVRGPGCQGWVFGLPPGINTEEWPLDPENGYPLMHGFTLLLPQDYRVHGPEYVALSFFATAPDHFDGGSFTVVGARERVLAGPSHPELHRLQDELDVEYAVVLLTQSEFDDALCLPPKPLFETQRPPEWMTIGAAASLWGHHEPSDPDLSIHARRVLGNKPPHDPAYALAIRWASGLADLNPNELPYEEIPSDNKAAAEFLKVELEDSDDERSRARSRRRNWLYNHIGGPIVSTYFYGDVSPYYIEFGEYFGGYNLAGRGAILDFQNMTIRWA